MAGIGHRSTLKQKNKSHNHGKHRSKRNLKREAQGKVNVKNVTKQKKIKEILRQEASQHRISGREDVMVERRGTGSAPPRLVVVVSLDKAIDMPAIVDLLKAADLSATMERSEQDVIHINASKLKKRLAFLVPGVDDLQGLMDAAKVADVLLLLMSGEKGMDRYGEHCLTCILGQGAPAHIFACQGLVNLSKKKLTDARKRINKKIEKWFPGDKFRSLDTWQDAENMWRQIVGQAQKPVHFRDARPFLLSEKLEFEENSSDDMEQLEEGLGYGTLKVSGYLRGQNLNVDQLVHIPGQGDFQMAQIDQCKDPYPLIVKGNQDRRQKVDKSRDEMSEASASSFCLAKSTCPESLQSEVIPDEMDQEQTWPTAEELGESKSVRVKTLKGVSDYQSNWIVDSGDSGDEEDASDVDMDDEKMADPAERSDDDDEKEDEDDALDTMTTTEVDENENYDEQMDMDDEKKMYERMKEERLNVHFPDEVDTPLETAASVRFARYRGLDSFQTSPWDPKESLPYDYGRIYRVSKHHYKRLKKISTKAKDDEDDENLPAEPGNFITVYVKNVPKSFIETRKPNQPITLYGLFANEQKMTLISTLITRMPGFKSPVKAKDPLTFQIGFRRFSASPIFSEHSFRNKFKMERFLPGTGFIVASVYAPIMFAPAPVLVFRENVMEKYDLVAKGSLMTLDTDRIVIKRVVLSGAPLKINKRSVVVRYMFFNREDIDFYKPIELRTKRGKRGHIKQALGTHGHMKCKFNGQLTSEDTVLMNLYKRVFPKWSYNPYVTVLPPTIDKEEVTDEEAEEEMVAEEEKLGEAYKMFD